MYNENQTRSPKNKEARKHEKKTNKIKQNKEAREDTEKTSKSKQIP